MASIIVTITNVIRSFQVDMEIPTDITVMKLKRDLSEALDGYMPGLWFDPNSVDIVCDRTGAVGTDEQTVESFGIWTGDYISIRERARVWTQ